MNNEHIAKIVKLEFEQTKTDFNKLLPFDSIIRLYKRFDKRISEEIAVSIDKPVCKSNCWYCCYFKVEASAIEIFPIIDFVKRRFSPDELFHLIDQTKQNISNVINLSYEEQLAANLKCPFLFNGYCSIYEVRPLKCRSFHSIDLSRCKHSYEDPTDLEYVIYHNPNIYSLSENLNKMFEEVLRVVGYDNQIYDLNSAFIEAFENPKCLKRFKNKIKTFLNAIVIINN